MPSTIFDSSEATQYFKRSVLSEESLHREHSTITLSNHNKEGGGKSLIFRHGKL